jgi:hypothetical protein
MSDPGLEIFPVQPFGKLLIVFGAVMILAGVLLMFTDKIPFLGKLPGDLNIKKENFQFYVPITTSILLSIILSLVVWAISYFSKK